MRFGAARAVSVHCSLRAEVVEWCLLLRLPAVNLPGTYYTIDALAGTVGAVTCPVDTYGPGLRKQRACVPCPPNYVTNGKTGQTSPMQCSEYKRAFSHAIAVCGRMLIVHCGDAYACCSSVVH
jgi:hypothetical protein